MQSDSNSSSARLLILGAHPDDAEIHAGGLVLAYRDLGREVKMISVTNGAAGHHQRTPEELVRIRRAEAAASGASVGAIYETWDFPDGELLPTLEVRRRIIQEIRTFAPDLVLTHRTNDYHPDHRAVGQAVQDASFMVTVPLVVPSAPALRKDPVVAYMSDLFTQPCSLRPDVVLDVSTRVDKIVSMMACHRSQFFEWLPYNQRILDQVPQDEAARVAWLREWYLQYISPRATRFREAAIAQWGEARGREVAYIEAYEISEYAAQPDDARRKFLFPPLS